MKKLILLLLTALLTVTGLYAISISEYADPSSWIPESLYIGMGNDKWALANISYNMDDQLSFSEHFYVEAPAYWLDVNMLADTFNINRSWLSTKFREKMGVGLSDYIVKCRINKAKELLKTDMSINQIAEQVGFSSKVVYCRAFKKYENSTSTQYRKIVNANADDYEE